MADVVPYVLKADGVPWQMLLPYDMWQTANFLWFLPNLIYHVYVSKCKLLKRSRIFLKYYLNIGGMSLKIWLLYPVPQLLFGIDHF